jgi:chromosome segregation ATPase
MERKEPTLTVGALDQDLATPARQTKSAVNPVNPPSPSAKATNASKVRPVSVDQPKPVGGGIVAGLALIVAIAATFGSGYLAWKLQQTQTLLLSADIRLQALESRLDFSNEESSQSVEAISAKLKWADAEIRKLWGVSYDTNRKTIKANSATIKTNSSQLAKIEKQAKAAAKASKSAQTLADTHKLQLASLKKLTSDDSVRIGEALKNLDVQRIRLQDTVDKANKANTDLARLRNDLGARVKNNEEAIEAIDAYRVRMNRELGELKKRAGLQ